MSKNKLLITIGDSWTYGIGNLHPELFKENMTREEKNEFHSNPIQTEYELNNSWGSWVSDNLGFDEWLNFSKPSRSFESMWKMFLETHPRELFSEYDVHVIIMSSYFSRLCLATDVKDWGNFDASSKIYEHYISYLVEQNLDNDIDDVFNSSASSVLKNAMFHLKDLGFKFLLGFNRLDDEVYFRNRYPKLSTYDIVVKPPFQDGFFHGNDIPEEWHVHYDGHINEKAYKMVGFHISDYVKRVHPDWVSPPNKSKKWNYSYNLNDTTHPLHSIIPDSEINLKTNATYIF